MPFHAVAHHFIRPMRPPPLPASLRRIVKRLPCQVVRSNSCLARPSAAPPAIDRQTVWVRRDWAPGAARTAAFESADASQPLAPLIAIAPPVAATAPYARHHAMIWALGAEQAPWLA